MADLQKAKSKYEVVPLEGIRKYVADRIEVDYQRGIRQLLQNQ